MRRNEIETSMKFTIINIVSGFLFSFVHYGIAIPTVRIWSLIFTIHCSLPSWRINFIILVAFHERGVKVLLPRHKAKLVNVGVHITD